MRRRRSSLARRLAAVALLFLPSSSIQAQRAEGAVFLLLPIGARAVGGGQAVVADRGGSESIWWNPAAIAHAAQWEIALHHSQSIVATGDAVSLLAPTSLVGTFALSFNVLNFGEQDVTQDPTGPSGRLLPRSFVYVASYATTLGARFNAGLSYKIVQLRFDCTGLCPDTENASAATSALDFGAQYDLSALIPVSVGVAVRNIGVTLQVNDREQADPLPTRLQLGATYRRAPLLATLPRTDVNFGLDAVTPVPGSSTTFRTGVELVHDRRFFARAGYVTGEGGGPSIGLGLQAGGFVLDFARVMGGLAQSIGEPPTHVSLRYLF